MKTAAVELELRRLETCEGCIAEGCTCFHPPASSPFTHRPDCERPPSVDLDGRRA